MMTAATPRPGRLSYEYLRPRHAIVVRKLEAEIAQLRPEVERLRQQAADIDDPPWSEPESALLDELSAAGCRLSLLETALERARLLLTYAEREEDPPDDVVGGTRWHRVFPPPG